MPDKKHFNVVVVGAGPAGANAARHAALGGLSVCLLDRLEAPSHPVRCGEGVGLKGMSLSVAIKPEWILSAIRRVKMISPSGTLVELANIGESYIIDRSIFDSDIVKSAIEAGAEFRNNTNVDAAERLTNGKYACHIGSEKVTADCLVLADGVESRLARDLGWNTRLSPSNMETCAIARVSDPSIAADAIEFHVGNRFAPGGYAWVMPRGEGIANVGLGILGSHSISGGADEFLTAFINHRFPNRTDLTNRNCGGVPVAPWLDPLVRGGVMIVGDAARQVNALNGGGIAYALHAGQLAGEAALLAFVNGKFDETKLSIYQKKWAKGHGKNQRITNDLKNFLITRRDDAFYDRIAESLKKRKALGYLSVFLRTFAGHPVMMWKTMKLFG